MKNTYRFVWGLILGVSFLFIGLILPAQQVEYPDALYGQGFSVATSNADRVDINYSIRQFRIDDILINGEQMKNIGLDGAFLYNEQGAPNLPGYSRFIAIPNGATPILDIQMTRVEIIQGINIAPAPRIPLDTDTGPLEYNKNEAIYNRNAFYPEQPVILSEVKNIRGVQTVVLGITPFQYNPVTKELRIFRDLDVDIRFEGGSDRFGDDRLRSRWWDPIMSDALINFSSLPSIDYDARIQEPTDVPGCEYLIITPTDAAFTQWADSIRRFRQQQGISTFVKTLTEVGGNTTTAIENYINNAYNTWTPPPAAVLLLGDYGTNAANSVVSPIYNSYCVSDNIYADVDNDHLPDVCLARITANNATQLQVMCTKFLNYERQPPASSYFYQHPITALGWQTERWFQICSETVGGFWKYVQGKDPTRINEVYSGNPSTAPWSTATNTSTILSFFGPSGLGYIPATPQEMPCCWTGGNATGINNAINSGAFVLMHRDHGSTTGWGEPAYSNSNIDGCTNTNLTFIFSINCLTGKYNNSSECFTEKFHRYTKNGNNSGALGLIAASEVSYSFVNDTYVWGVMDNLWTNFMPSYGTTPASRGVMPCFGNAAGKYFLQQSNWPYNTSNKQVTYHLYHHHGDAFMTVYSEVPQNLTVVHNSTIPSGSTSFQVTANVGALIALTYNDEILGTGTGTGAPLTITIPGTLTTGQFMRVTVTKQNYFRYTALVQVVPPGGPIPDFTANMTNICIGQGVNFTDLSSGTPTSWTWSFPGGNPSSSTVQNPQNIVYPATGNYNVTLTVSNAIYTNSLTKVSYIHVTAPAATPGIPEGDTLLCENNSPTMYTIPSIPDATSYNWVFDPPAAGVMVAADTSATITWNAGWTGYATLKVQAVNGCGPGSFSPDLNIHLRPFPAVPNQPTGPTALCQGVQTSDYTTDPVPNATSYLWQIEPPFAGIITGSSNTSTVYWSLTWSGNAAISVKSVNDCNESLFSDPLDVTVNPLPVVSLGNDTILCDFESIPLDAGNPGATYLWSTGATTQTIVVDSSGVGYGTTTPSVEVTLSGCTSTGSINITFTTCTGVPNLSETEKCDVYPNPGSGIFHLALFSMRDDPAQVMVSNILGKEVLSKHDIAVSGNTSISLDLANEPDGIYFLVVKTTRQTYVKKLIISR
ncbi:MAG: T9SS type A sorting domain-containing protein [Bacteroidetes bacterium]|nr:T9SS type A sorting domain-containing protein [Bacteroidota bacterium]